MSGKVSRQESAVEKRDSAAKTVRLTRARRAVILKALADPHRLLLVERIARAACPLSCAQARAAVPVSAATLSHHVKELQSAGLIHAERAGKFVYLSLHAEVWSALLASLTALAPSCCKNTHPVRKNS